MLDENRRARDCCTRCAIYTRGKNCKGLEERGHTFVTPGISVYQHVQGNIEDG